MRSTKGIVVPPSTGSQQCEGWLARTYSPEVANAERKVLMNFYGWIIDNAMYSQGVRWQVKQLFGNVSDMIISGDKLNGDRYIESLREAVFCLAPSGFGYGVRITYTMLTGCIPVIIQDGVRQPLDDVVPYYKFAVTVPQRDIPDLERLLRAVTPEEIRQMRHYQHLHHSYFCWFEGEGKAPLDARAYEGVLESMSRKLYQLTFKS